MTQYFSGTLLASPIVRGSSGDTYGTHHSILGVGGFMEVKTIAERDLIPINSISGLYYDGISSGQRRLGMLVYVVEDNNVYQLNIDYTQWSASTSLQKINLLADNNKWVKTFSTTIGEKISKTFYQVGHNFELGYVIAFDSTLNSFQASSISSAPDFEPLGIVSEIPDIDNFTVTFSGYINTTGLLDNDDEPFVGGKLYYLSGNAGLLQSYAPITVGETSKPMIATLSSGNTAIVLQYNSKLIGENGVSIEEFNLYTGITAISLNETITGATNLGVFTGTDAIQSLTISALGSVNDGIYNSLWNYYYRDNSGIIRIGTPSGEPTRRAYVIQPARNKSFIWNTFTGSSNQVGWILVNGDVEASNGIGLTGITYSGTPYTEAVWNDGSFYNNGGDLTLDVSGDLNSGSPYNNSGPIYSFKSDNNLNLRSLKSSDEGSLKMYYDNDFIYLNVFHGAGTITGATNGLNLSNGIVKIGGDIIENTILHDTIGVGLQYSDSYGDTFLIHSLVDKEYVDMKSNRATIANTSGNSYFVLPSDYAIGARSNPSGCTVYLPSTPAIGHTVVVYDRDGVAGTTVNTYININGNGKLILDWNAATINSDYGSITFLYNGTFWSVIAFTSTPSYSL